jgi:hypothetical protein
MKLGELIEKLSAIVAEDATAAEWYVFIRVPGADDYPKTDDEPMWFDVGVIDDAESGEPTLISLGEFAQG